MPKKNRYIILIIIGFIIGINSVSAATFSTDNVVEACGFDTIPEVVPKITSSLYNMAKVLTPIILIVMGMVDFANAVMQGDEQKQKKSQKKFITRLLAAIIVFMVMSTIQAVFNKIDSAKSQDFSNCMNCILSNNGCGPSKSNKPSDSGSGKRGENPAEKIINDTADKVTAYGLGILNKNGITACDYCSGKSTALNRLKCTKECGCKNLYTNESDCNTKSDGQCRWSTNKCISTSGGSTKQDDNSGSSIGSTIQEKIVSYATKFEGHPYVWGGTTLCEDWQTQSGCGVDCSGFVQSVYGNMGYDKNCIGRTTTTQAVNLNAQPYSGEEQLQKGDALFFYSGLSHVGIYIGDGKYVHASTSKTGVKISQLSDNTPVKYGRVTDKCAKQEAIK